MRRVRASIRPTRTRRTRRARCPTISSGRSIGYGAINLRTNGGYSRYHSLQVTANRRSARGWRSDPPTRWRSRRARAGFRTFTIWPTPTTTPPATGGMCCRSTACTIFPVGLGTPCAPPAPEQLAGRGRRRLHDRRAGNGHVHHDGQLRLHGGRRRRAGQRRTRMRSGSSQERAVAPALVRYVVFRSPVGPRRRRATRAASTTSGPARTPGSHADQGDQARWLA